MESPGFAKAPKKQTYPSLVKILSSCIHSTQLLVTFVWQHRPNKVVKFFAYFILVIS